MHLQRLSLAAFSSTDILPVLPQAAYDLRAIFRNFTGTSECFGSPADGGPSECTSGAYYFLPSPALTSNATQRLTSIRFFLTAAGGDVSLPKSCWAVMISMRLS